MKKKCIIAAVCFGLFLLLILLQKTVDVAVVGPEDARIGLSKLNVSLHEMFGVHLGWYTLTNILGYLAILIALCFAAVGALQLIYRRSLLKVDKEILLLGCLYALTLLFYVFFEKVVVNYRPILMPDGEGLEASFPSSHTVLSYVILGSGMELVKKYAKKSQPIQLALTVVFAVMLALIVAGRLLSGVHWFTDIIGGILLSAALLNAYEGLLKLWKQRAKAQK
ncbi:MAG: phosphatase PAP2 family protein [Clostridia bacterium]|nr:phosphatase PAP2 family protein [Clostridia bacterium]